MKTIRTLGKDYYLIQTDYEGWISFWIIDPHGEDVKSFSSVQRALDWWQVKKKEMLNEAESPKWRKARREAEKLVKKMGGNFDLMPQEEKDGWIKECLI